MEYSIDSYVVVDKNNHIVTMDSGLKCQQMACKWNDSPHYRAEFKPFRAMKLTATFTV